MDFREWYQRVHGYLAFPWQIRLADQIREQPWPETIDLPTGAGKTSVIDIWVWAYLQGLPVPTRLIYVIDRRLVVDSVTQHAESLQKHVPELVVAKLRGGMLPDESWIMDPTRPTVIVSTVDQAGSRLLWRAYGVSARVAPLHAALIGNDALIVLDEAHLSTPFAETLNAIRSQRRGALGLPWYVVEMTATPVAGKTSFQLATEDRENALLKARLNVAKPALLVKSNEERLVQDTVKHALNVRKGGAEVVGVVLNRVDDARAVFEALPGDKVLIIGLIRPADRDVLLNTYLPRIETGSRSKGREPLYVVATQTIEVGADLDFDALATESAPVDALRQRFGRLNRFGELDESPAVVLHPNRRKDWVYGQDTKQAWKWLQEVAEKVKGRKVVDFGLAAMTNTVENHPPPQRTAIVAPPLLPTHIRSLSHTSPAPRIDVSPWLHGESSAADTDVSLVWRADLSLGNETDWEAIAKVAPPIVGEMMPCRMGGARFWLHNRPVVIWRGGETQLASGDDIVAGDTIVVPSLYGGYDRWGWAPQSMAPVTDVGNFVEPSRARVRLHPAINPEHRDTIAELVNGQIDVQRVLTALGMDIKGRLKTRDYPNGMIVIAGSWRPEGLQPKPITLSDHLREVGKVAKRLSHRLPAELAEAVIKASTLHDIGKQDEQFQVALGAFDKPLAKSGMASASQATAAWRMSGLPRGWRHEMSSLIRLPDSAPDLVCYLVGVHHGYGRPMLPSGPDIDLWRRCGGPDWAELFERLSREYDVWGLAYLETIVRLSDWIRSREEQEDAN